MGKKNSKSNKKFGAPCPDCADGYLTKDFRRVDKGGVVYDEEYLVCSECSYEKKVNVSMKRYREVYNPKW